MDSSGVLQARSARGAIMKPDDMSAWISWALYATAGLAQEGDALMREHGESVRRFAHKLARVFPVERRATYRGVLLESWRVPEHGVLSPRESDTYSSWTEDKLVARWFADPAGFLARVVLDYAPDVVGWLATRAAPEPGEILYHHTWASAFPVPLWTLAREHPAMAHAADEVEWNMRTQQEVILMPTSYAVERHEVDTDTSEALNARLTAPWVRQS